MLSRLSPCLKVYSGAIIGSKFLIYLLYGLPHTPDTTLKALSFLRTSFLGFSSGVTCPLAYPQWRDHPLGGRVRHRVLAVHDRAQFFAAANLRPAPHRALAGHRAGGDSAAPR